MKTGKYSNGSFVDTIEHNERWQVEKKAKILRFMLNSNTMSLAEYCRFTGRIPEFDISDCDVVVGYHEALFEIYDTMQIVARMYPEKEAIQYYT